MSRIGKVVSTLVRATAALLSLGAIVFVQPAAAGGAACAAPPASKR